MPHPSRGRRPVPRHAVLRLAVVRLSLATVAVALLALPARAQDVYGVRVSDMPSLSPAESAQWRERLGLIDDRSGRARPDGYLGRLARLFADGGTTDDGLTVASTSSPNSTRRPTSEGARNARAARQATLGLVELNGDFGPRTQAVDSSGRFVTIEGDVQPLPGKPGLYRAGVIAAHWVTTTSDVSGDPGRPKGNPWRAPDRVPENWDLNNLEMNWKGIGEVRGSRGHYVPNAGATFSETDKRATFQSWRNAHFQTEYSNAGAYRDFEKMIQEVASSHRYNVINIAGPVWSPVTYTRSDGTVVTQEADVVEFRGKRLPKPAAYARFSLIYPTKTPDGREMDIASALSYARPVGIIVPNADDPDLFVRDYSAFLATGAEIEQAMKIKLFPQLSRGPKSRTIRKALLNHRDDARNLPVEQRVPDWKLKRLRGLANRRDGIGRLARRRLPHSETQRQTNAKRSAESRRGVRRGWQSQGRGRRARPARP